jgi:MFS family permease
MPARASASADARRLILARGLRGFADGAVSVLLASYLTHLGLTPFQVGAIVTGTLLGSAGLTIAIGIVGHRLRRRPLLLAAAALMAGTGIGFVALTAFWPLLVVAVIGTLNPSAGDVSVFLPVEQAALAETSAAGRLTATFAWYNLAGTLAGALGALASGLPEMLASMSAVRIVTAERLGFVVYVATAVCVSVVYGRLSPRVEHEDRAASAPLARSRRIVLRLAALFSLDSFGGGFVVQSLLVLWLYRRFDLSVSATGMIFFLAGLLAAFSQFLSSHLARRIGRIRTMVYTHLPANVFLMIAGVVPSAELAVTFLLLRTALSQMDVPARQSYVMAIVPPEERAAASSFTNVPRSLATALAPLLAGMMLERSSFGWPLLVGGFLKAVYDVLLLIGFRAVTPPGEDELTLRR